MNFPSLSKQLNIIDGIAPSPHVPDRIPVAGTCPRHNLPLFRLITSQVICAGDCGCVWTITADGLVSAVGV